MILQSYGVILDLVKEGRGLKKDDIILISYIDERLRTIKILVQFHKFGINRISKFQIYWRASVIF